MIAGYPKTYKTTFVQDLAVALASGRPFLDRFPVDCAHNVGIILMEGLLWQAARRTRRLSRGHGVRPTVNTRAISTSDEQTNADFPAGTSLARHDYF